eukprot:scaffold901_cov167-Amphora_coffeaeformis.AAC.21
MGVGTVARVVVVAGAGGGAWGLRGVICVELCETLPGVGEETSTSGIEASRGVDDGGEISKIPSSKSRKGDCVAVEVTFCASATAKT